MSGLRADLNDAGKNRKQMTGKPCALRRAYEALDEEDRKVLLDAVYGKDEHGVSFLVSPLAIDEALQKRGLYLPRRTVTHHRMKGCVGCRNWPLS